LRGDRPRVACPANTPYPFASRREISDRNVVAEDAKKILFGQTAASGR
jgi:hypothetical protein